MRKQTKLWATQDGRRIRICDMTDRHLQNSIKMIEKAAEVATSRAILDGYKMLSTLQGEMAIHSAESDLQYLEEFGIKPQDVCSLYPNLIKDRERRTNNV